ncbi:cbb3-type cytochrome oxidase maturation protein [Salinisphaera sp. S4-8]
MIVLVLLPLTLVLVGIAVWAFFWAVGDGQFDDMDSPAYRILLDDDDDWSTPADQNKTTQHEHPPEKQSAGDDTPAGAPPREPRQ